MRYVFLVGIVFLMGSVMASEVVCTIVEDRVLVEIEGDDLVLLDEYSDVEVGNGSLSFITRDFIRKDGEWIFALPVLLDEEYSLKVILPSGFVLSDGLVYPKNYELGSDGKSIILDWDSVGEEVVVFYEGDVGSEYWHWILVFCIAAGMFFYWKNKEIKLRKEVKNLKKKKVNKKIDGKKMLTQNLFGEEKGIVEFLDKNGACWSKEIVKGLGISKIMASRKIRSLVEKGIVKKENFGRENRISLVKK